MSDFISQKNLPLADTLAPTSFPGLKLIKGSDEFLFLANLNYYKKLKLIRQIKGLPAQRIILDVGTGSSYNTLDFFIIAKPGILVITPEPTAIENTYYFLRSCVVRILKLYLQYYKYQDLLNRLSSALQQNSASLQAFLASLTNSGNSGEQILWRALKNFKPGLIINKSRSEKDFLLGQSLIDVARKYLFLEMDFLGTIPYDERIHWSLKNFVPYIREYPDSSVSQALKSMAEKLVNNHP